jgi:DNA-binding protein HU-beta
MNRSDLIAELSRCAGMPAEGARLAIDALFGTAADAGLIAGALKRGDRVQLAGFGTFEARSRKERPGHNPHTGERLVIPAVVAPVFRAGTTLKATLRR